MIPILVKSLTQDVTARSIITRSFGTVSELAVVIREAYEIVKRSKGSKKCIEIAKKNIPAALAKLNQSIADIEKLDSDAIIQFNAESPKIIEIIGPEAARFGEMKEKLDMKIRKLRNKQHDLISGLGEKKGEVESNYYLIAMSEKHLSSTEDDLKAAEERTKELDKMNDNLETTIQNILDKIKKTVTESGSKGWFWPTKWFMKKTFDVDNPNRYSEQKFYDNIIKCRLERKGLYQQDQKAKKKAIDELAKDIANYKLAYIKAKEELQGMQTSLHNDLVEIEREIESLLAEKREIERNALDTFKRIGLQGSTLISCLNQVSTFAQSLGPGASAYAPFATVLRVLKRMVEQRIELFSSDDKEDVFLAGTLLMEQVVFISDYCLTAREIMKTSDDYDEQAIRQRMKTALTL